MVCVLSKLLLNPDFANGQRANFGLLFHTLMQIGVKSDPSKKVHQ